MNENKINRRTSCEHYDKTYCLQQGELCHGCNGQRGKIVNDKIGNCNDINCNYFDEYFELNCCFSSDNYLCIKNIKQQKIYTEKQVKMMIRTLAKSISERCCPIEECPGLFYNCSDECIDTLIDYALSNPTEEE